MSRLKSPEEIQQETQRYQTQFATDKLLLVYVRQSTKKQVLQNLESASQQALDTRSYAMKLGWTADKIKPFDENLVSGVLRNASGRLPIADREGLKTVLQCIGTGTVGAVLVQDVSRLFRDEDGVEPRLFAKKCKEHHVIILSLDGEQYDFNHPRNNAAKNFAEDCDDAADYLKQIKKMNKLRRRKGMRGGYIGTPCPTGFMLEGTDKHYVSNPVWAPIMARLFKRFRELDANFAQLRREIVGKPIFPYLPEDVQKCVGRISLTKVEGGYSINNWDSLKSLLTNLALIGHRVYDGRIVQKNAHPAIVDESDFWYAWEHLSDTDLDGIPVLREKTKRHSKEPRTALLAYTRHDGKAVVASSQGAVYVVQSSGRAHYVIKNYHEGITDFISSIGTSDLDSVFTMRLIERLEHIRAMHMRVSALSEETVMKVGTAVKNMMLDMVKMEAPGASVASIERWQPLTNGSALNTGSVVEESPYLQLQTLQQETETKIVRIEDTIAEVQQELARLEREHRVEFDIMTDKELRANKEARVRLANRLADLEKKQAEEKATWQDIQEVHNLLEDSRTKWNDLTLEQKQRYTRLITSSITLDKIADGWLKLSIEWTPFLGDICTDTAIIYVKNGGGRWTDKEDSILQRYYGNASRNLLLEELPERSWQAIWTRANKLGLHRKARDLSSSSDIPSWLSLEDSRVMGHYGLSLEPGMEKAYWWLAEIFSSVCSAPSINVAPMPKRPCATTIVANRGMEPSNMKPAPSKKTPTMTERRRL